MMGYITGRHISKHKLFVVSATVLLCLLWINYHWTLLGRRRLPFVQPLGKTPYILHVTWGGRSPETRFQSFARDVWPPLIYTWSPELPRPLDRIPISRNNVTSLNPPSSDDWSYLQRNQAAGGILANRIVIGLALGVHSGKVDVSTVGVEALPIFQTLLPSFLRTAQPNHIYRFYLGFDFNDPVFSSASWRAEIQRVANQRIRDENAQRWHPPGNDVGRTLDPSSLLVSMHWVHCNYSGKPAWAHSDAAIAAFSEGADYVLRTNDDTAFPQELNWVDRMVWELRHNRPVRNLGVVGPACSTGNTDILTHDFTHRTHAAIFEHHYPRSLPDWSSDDWITHVYGVLGLMSERQDIRVHHTLFAQRYKQQDQSLRLSNLNAEVRRGVLAIHQWALSHHNVSLPFTLEELHCC